MATTSTGRFAYQVYTVNNFRLTTTETAYGDSAQQVAERYIRMGYRKVEVAPAAPVNGYTGLPYQPGDTASLTR